MTIHLRTLSSLQTSGVLALAAAFKIGQKRPSILGVMGQGMSFIYRHRTLAPLAISTHVWFIANSAAITLFALFALRHLDYAHSYTGSCSPAPGLADSSGLSLLQHLHARLVRVFQRWWAEQSLRWRGSGWRSFPMPSSGL